MTILDIFKTWTIVNREDYNDLVDCKGEMLKLVIDYDGLVDQIRLLKFKVEAKDSLINEYQSKVTEDTLEDYWNNKRTKVVWRYPARDRIKVDPRIFFQTDNTLPNYSRLKSNDSKALNALGWVKKNIKYTLKDETNNEYWKFAYETMKDKRGDCIAEYEEIYTKEGIKKAKDVKVGDLVLSYDLKKKKFCYKPIINKWDKGKLQIKRVHFRNGQFIDVTDNHHFAVRENQKTSNYIKQDLKDIDLSRWWKRKVPIAKKIPYELKDISWLNEDLCYVLGHYLAEGWKEKKGKVQSSGYDLIEKIIPLLEKNEIPFTEYKNNSGVPCINFLMSNFKDFLKLQKKNSFDIHLQEDLFRLPVKKLQAILDGFWLGDGHNGNYEDKRGFKSNKQEVYSTSSEQWAKDIQRIGLQLGISFHIWKQEKHQGLGNKPIWRITYNPESHFLKDYGYKDISEVSISYIEDLGKYQTYDWEVEDTHTFVFKNGIITFQCEDGAILMANIMLNSGVPYWRIRINAGNVVGGGHAYVTYLKEKDDKWYVLDWCYWYNASGTLWKNAKKYYSDSDGKKGFGIWGSWNAKYIYGDLPKND